LGQILGSGRQNKSNTGNILHSNVRSTQ